MQPHANLAKALPYFHCRVFQNFSVVMQKHKIVTVSQISANAETTCDEMVQVVQHPVGKPLAGQVSDGQSLRPFNRGEKVIPVEPVENLLLFVGAIHYQIHEPQYTTVFYESPKGCFEYLMVNAGKVLPDVALYGISITPHKTLEAIGCRMGPFVLPACIAIGMEMTIKDWFENIHQRMMNNSVPIRRRRYQARLGSVYPV
jgi:hypothetical protein